MLNDQEEGAPSGEEMLREELSDSEAIEEVDAVLTDALPSDSPLAARLRAEQEARLCAA